MTSFKKSPRIKNKKLLDLARGKPCLMQTAHDCLGGDGSTTVAAHSNELRHGKGKGIKTHDHYTVWSCVKCHRWYDEGGAAKTEKQAAFEVAMHRQVREWAVVHAMSNSDASQAAGWALSEHGVIPALLS